MSENNCYDEVISLIKEAERRFAGSIAVDKNIEQKLKAVCSGIDEMINKSEFDYYEVVIDDTIKRLTFSLFGDEIILEGEQMKSFLAVAKNLSSFSFVKSKEDGLRVDLNIDGLWGDQ